MKDDKKAVTLALLAVFFWSTASTAFKIALAELSFIQLLLVATYTSTIVIGFFLIAQGKLNLIWACSKKQWATSIGLSLLNPTGYYLVLLKAYELLPAQIAQPLNYTWPLVLVFMSAPLLKQKIKQKSFVALLVSFGGVIVISTQDSFDFLTGSDLKGILLASGSSLIWAHYWLFNLMDKRDEILKLFLNFSFGSIFISLLAWNTDSFALPFGSGLCAGIYVGFFEMGLAFIFWLKAMNNATSTDKISNLVYLSPFVALIFIATILKESLYTSTFIGLLFIVGGIFIQKISWEGNIKKKNFS